MRTDRRAEPAASVDYVARVHRAIDHIVLNLERPLSLEEVAKAAGFSPFHFHRVFKSLLGETLGHFVKRQRLERALRLMSHAPGRSLTDIALGCGFASSSDFSRSFKQRYGVPPRAFDLAAFRQAGREEFERVMANQDGAPRFTALPAGANPDGFTVTLRDLPARTVAYIRVLNPYRDGVVRAAYDRLVAWAVERGRADGQWLGYMWEEPELVALAKCRYDAALVVEDVERAGEIGRFELAPMRVAEVVVKGDLALEARAIEWLYTTWLPASGYVPDDHPAFEAWIGRPYAHGDAYFELTFQLPVQRP